MGAERLFSAKGEFHGGHGWRDHTTWYRTISASAFERLFGNLSDERAAMAADVLEALVVRGVELGEVDLDE